MMNNEMYMDEYFRGFASGEYDKLRDEQKKLEDATTWEEVTTKFQVLPLADPMSVQEKISTTNCTIPIEVLLDTCDNAGIMLSYDGKELCLRDCAMPTLLSTTGIDGSAISRSTKEDLAGGLTYFLRSSREKSRVMYRAGKVSAIYSKQYEYMPISDLLDICDELVDTFGEADFLGGSITHSQTTADFAFPDSSKTMTKAYNAILVDAGRAGTGANLTPIVQFRSSDTSNASAKLLTYLKLDNERMIPIGGVAIEHRCSNKADKNGNVVTRMSRFREEAGLLYSKMEYDINDLLAKMLDTPIKHPGNCFVGLCNYARIPQKWGGIIEEDIRADWPDGSDCTFLDLYEELTRTTALAIRDGFTPYSKRVLELEEDISKIARNRERWQMYDLAGTVAWGAGKNA